jgi:hypothetical protein
MPKDNRTDAQVLRDALPAARRTDDRLTPGLTDALVKQLTKAAEKAEKKAGR